jgi:hypothetical protein
MVYQLGTSVSVLGKIFSGVGGPLPATTMFVIGLSETAFSLAGGLLIAGLVLKERWVKSSAMRDAITLIVFLSTDWFFYFCFETILKSLVDLSHKIG